MHQINDKFKPFNVDINCGSEEDRFLVETSFTLLDWIKIESLRNGTDTIERFN